MSKRKILICGASGFIGRNLAEFFLKNDEYEIYGTYLTREIDIPKLIAFRADLTQKGDVWEAVKGKDIIIQAAATTSGAKDIINRPYYHVTDNAVMNSLILRAAFENKVSHVIFFSCSVMYQSSDVPVKEEDFNPSDEMKPEYFGIGWTKVYIEKMCEFYARMGQTKFTVIRHSNIYGPYDKFDLERSHVFGATVTKVLTTKDGKIVIWGTGEEERDLLYVSDLMHFVRLSIDRQESKFEIFNVGYGTSISVMDLAKKIISISGRNIKIEYNLTMPTIKTKLCLDISKAKKLLNWEPNVTLDDGITKTIQWYKRNYFLRKRPEIDA